MSVQREDLHKLIDRLKESDQRTVFDFLQYLIERSEINLISWEEIDQAEPDNDPLSEAEIRQLNREDGYISGEDAKRDFGLQVDLP